MDPLQVKTEAVLARKGTRFQILQGDAPLSFEAALALLASSPAFREDLTRWIVESKYTALRWETPALTLANADRPFEFVLVDAPYLECAPEPDAFSDYFDSQASDVDVLAVSNLGRTARLIVPRQRVDPQVYIHLKAFLRGAPSDQVHAMWQCVASTVQEELSSRPLWLSTAGGAVSWLHVRVEFRPKYYVYRPYTHDI